MRHQSVGRYLALSFLIFAAGMANANKPAKPAPSNEDVTHEMRGHYAAGQTAYLASRLDEALLHFELGRIKAEQTHGPELAAFVYNIARCHDKLGHDVEALAAYKQYLEIDPIAHDRKIVEQRIAEFEAKIAKAKPPLADVRLASPLKPMALPSLAEPLSQPEIAQSDPGLLENPSAASAPSTASDTPSWWSYYRWPMIGATVVAVVFVAGSWVVASVGSDYDALQETCPYNCPEDRWGRLETRANIGYALWGVAGVLAVADTGLFYLTYRRNNRPGLAQQIGVLPSSNGILAFGRF